MAKRVVKGTAPRDWQKGLQNTRNWMKENVGQNTYIKIQAMVWYTMPCIIFFNQLVAKIQDYPVYESTSQSDWLFRGGLPPLYESNTQVGGNKNCTFGAILKVNVGDVPYKHLDKSPKDCVSMQTNPTNL